MLRRRREKNCELFYVCFTAFLVLCELPPSGRKFGFSHELSDLAHLTLLAGPIGFNEIGQSLQQTLVLVINLQSAKLAHSPTGPGSRLKLLKLNAVVLQHHPRLEFQNFNALIPTHSTTSSSAPPNLLRIFNTTPHPPPSPLLMPLVTPSSSNRRRQ